MKGMGLLLAIVLMVFPQVTAAAVPTIYTNANFYSSAHDAPASLFQYMTGGFYGYTVTGKFYEQLPVYNEFGVHMQRFSIDEAYFYVTDRGTIDATDDLAAVSIYFSRG